LADRVNPRRLALGAKLFATRTIGILTGDANIATDVANHGQGTLGQGNLWLTIPGASGRVPAGRIRRAIHNRSGR